MKIVILTGAGLSAESGLGTFRDAGGIWAQYDLSEVATPEGFAADPGKVHDFYNARRANAAQAVPNAAHVALARLQAEHHGDVVIITQNVDDLHEQAGSTVLHMHGRLDRARCTACDARLPAPAILGAHVPCPTCGQKTLRPDIVWFGEFPNHLDESLTHVQTADLFVAIGTSGQVYPAAGFVEVARQVGAETLCLTLDAAGLEDLFDTLRLGPATECVPDWVADVLKTASGP